MSWIYAVTAVDVDRGHLFSQNVPDRNAYLWCVSISRLAQLLIIDYKAWFELAVCLQMRFILLQRYQFWTGIICAHPYLLSFFKNHFIKPSNNETKFEQHVWPRRCTACAPKPWWCRYVSIQNDVHVYCGCSPVRFRLCHISRVLETVKHPLNFQNKTSQKGPACSKINSIHNK